MTLRISYVLVASPYDYQAKTFTGWDRADCHKQLSEWERSMGDALLEWHQVYKH